MDTRMDIQEEVIDIVEGIWAKLQALPKAGALEIGAFSILVLFVGTFVLLVVISCTTCCTKAKRQSTKVQPV